MTDTVQEITAAYKEFAVETQLELLMEFRNITETEIGEVIVESSERNRKLTNLLEKVKKMKI